MSGHGTSANRLSGLNAAHEAEFAASLRQIQDNEINLEAAQNANEAAATEAKLEAENAQTAVFPIRDKKLESRQDNSLKIERAKRTEYSVLTRKETNDLAEEFSQRQDQDDDNRRYINLGLDASLLSQLAFEEIGIGINEDSTYDEIINVVRRRMTKNGNEPDVAIINKTLEFLLEITRKQLTKPSISEEAKLRLTKIEKKLDDAKVKFANDYKVKLQVTRNIIEAVDVVSEATQENIKQTLERYRDIVHDKLTKPSDLLPDYKLKGYDFKDKELKALYTCIGGDLKRNNLETAEMVQINNATQGLRAVHAVFTQAKVNLKIADQALNLNGVFDNHTATTA